ncbi:unnamed protein product [Symbiodinium sp. CCMP2592]|nr:unnamed protein product [Symbiodinium sp. CCMP2592]CAE7429281.1 unnamed protein product [Symbiodinium sp. CCMP2592]
MTVETVFGQQQPEPEPNVPDAKCQAQDYVEPHKDRASRGLAEVYARCRAFDCIRFELPARSHLTGFVLLHASSTIERLFDDHAPMVFKIGFTHNPAFRWANSRYGYAHDPYDRWDAMVILYLASNPHGPAMLESALIDKYGRRPGCRNINRGGDGVKVPAKAVVRTARNVLSDIGPQAAASSKGLKRLAECSLSNAERDAQTLLSKKMKLSLPIPLETLGQGKLNFPVLRLRSWAQFLLDRNLWHILCGLLSPDTDREKAILRGFWAEFQRHSPQHPVFELGLPLEDTVPMVFHGDEGRGRRRQGWLATNYHSIIGRGIQAALDKDAREKKRGRYVKLRCNYIGHSLTNRFGHAGLPKAVYSDPEIFKAVLEDAASEALFMTEHGVFNPRMGTRYMIILNVVGDWSWLHKAGGLSRTYHNMEKAGAKAKAKPKAAAKAKKSKPPKEPVGICHLCRAGQKDVPFEDIYSRQPLWLRTMFQQQPWIAPPSFARLHHPVGEEASIFAFDIFHAFHLGVGKTHVSSCLAMLSDVTAGSNIDLRFEALNAEWKSFKTGLFQPKLTPEFIGWESRSDFPSGSWHKGQLTTDLMRFLEHKFEQTDLSGDIMLQKAAEGTCAINQCLRLLYENDSVFLQPDLARSIAEHGLQFLRRYSFLAKRAHDTEKSLWGLIPKIHAVHHVLVKLLQDAEDGRPSLHPLCFGVQQDEDYVGRPSRLSRRVSSRLVSTRVLQRYLQDAYAKYVSSNLIVPS